jgi:hypothetical protein
MDRGMDEPMGPRGGGGGGQQQLDVEKLMLSFSNNPSVGPPSGLVGGQPSFFGAGVGAPPLSGPIPPPPMGGPTGGSGGMMGMTPGLMNLMGPFVGGGGGGMGGMRPGVMMGGGGPPPGVMGPLAGAGGGIPPPPEKRMRR